MSTLKDAGQNQSDFIVLQCTLNANCQNLLHTVVDCAEGPLAVTGLLPDNLERELLPIHGKLHQRAKVMLS